MSFLSRIMGREQDKGKIAVEPPPCPHTVLIPHWDSIDDMGKDDRATSFDCQSCSATFSPDEAKTLRRATAERLRMN